MFQMYTVTSIFLDNIAKKA